VAACEQSGRNRLLDVRQALSFQEYLSDATEGARWLLSLDASAPGLRARAGDLAATAPITLLSGPEGGLAPTKKPPPAPPALTAWARACCAPKPRRWRRWPC
jgi:16S rRNA (uracil1498-N3)-methyltransferase